jgi:hypothetical protein
MAFFTIFVTDGLAEGDHRRALRAGPSTVSTRRRTHEEMLTSAGFESVEEVPLTDEFLVTARAWYGGRERYAAELTAAEGERSFRERQADNAAQLAAIEAGLLQRSLFVAR